MDLEQTLRTSFKAFLRLLWKQLALPEPTRAQLAMAEYLQYGGQRIQLQMFRGCGKSWVTAAFVMWNLFVDRNKKILVVSASKQRADDFSLFCQRCINDFSFLKHLSNADDSDARWSRVSFDVKGCDPAQSPSVKSVGITSAMTGSRADLIIPDDVENPGNSATDMQREKLLHLTTEFESILTPKDDSRIIYLGTPQSQFTVYKALEARGYRPMVWPARYPKPEDMVHYGENLAAQLQKDLEKDPGLVGKQTDTRFSDRLLREREMTMTQSTFQLQFQINTSLSDLDRFPLRLADIPVMPLDLKRGPGSITWGANKDTLLSDIEAIGLPGDRWYSPLRISDEFFEWTNTIVAVDPSGRGRDETGVVVMSELSGNLFVRAVRGFKDGYSDATLTAILRLVKLYGAHTCLVESNFGDGTVMRLLEKHAQEMKVPVAMDEVRSFVRKEDRILDVLEPITTQHRLVIDKEAVMWDLNSNQDCTSDERMAKTLAYQMTRLCREKGAIKFDDRVDALAMAAQWFVDELQVSQMEAQKQRRQSDWLKVLEAFEYDSEAATDRLALGRPIEAPRGRRGIQGRMIGGR
jgi:hypothetical protein